MQVPASQVGVHYDAYLPSVFEVWWQVAYHDQQLQPASAAFASGLLDTTDRDENAPMQQNMYCHRGSWA